MPGSSMEQVQRLTDARPRPLAIESYPRAIRGRQTLRRRIDPCSPALIRLHYSMKKPPRLEQKSSRQETAVWKVRGLTQKGNVLLMVDFYSRIRSRTP